MVYNVQILTLEADGLGLLFVGLVGDKFSYSPAGLKPMYTGNSDLEFLILLPLLLKGWDCRCAPPRLAAQRRCGTQLCNLLHDVRQIA